jgi:hypothetical protein
MGDAEEEETEKPWAATEDDVSDALSGECVCVRTCVCVL